jgi:enolase
MKIKRLSAHQILDSRGQPTIEVRITLENGEIVSASAPSGASVGSHEAVELRDHDFSKFLGLSVDHAVANVNGPIASHLKGKSVSNQEDRDKDLLKLDGTDNKSKMGGNAIFATSAALAKAGAVAEDLPLFAYIAKLANYNHPLYMPTPMFNVINGGLHGTGNLDFQEFMVVPARRVPYTQALRMGAETYLHLKDVLKKRGLLISVGDEGGFTPTLYTNSSALDLLVEATRAAGFTMGQEMFIALDIAANQIRHGDRYFVKDSSNPMSTDNLINFYQGLVDRYQVLALEDPIDENDLSGWKKISQALSGKALIIADDLTVSDPHRVRQAIADQAITGVIIKLNEIGTITEAVEVAKIAKESNITSIVSHRAGETGDTFIADFAVGVGADYIKAGAPARGERVIKYNRLLEIEELLTSVASNAAKAS